MVSKKNTFILCFFCLALGASLSFFKKPEVKIEEKIEYKEVVKVVEVEKKDLSIITNKEKTTLPDGTIVEKENQILVDKSQKQVDSDSQKAFKSDLSHETVSKKSHRIQLFTEINDRFKQNSAVSYSYLFKPAFIKGEINDNRQWKISVGLELEF